MAPFQPLRLPARRLPVPMRVLVAVVLPAAATLVLPPASPAPCTSSIAVLALVALVGVYGWLAARATVEQRLPEIAFIAALATALLAPGGGSLLVPAALAMLRYRGGLLPCAANDNAAAPADGWVPITPARAKLLLDQTAA